MVYILNKEEVNANYTHWDYYRYSDEELIRHAAAYYLNISKDSIVRIKEFSKTYHITVE